MAAQVILFFFDLGLERVAQLLSICSKQALVYVLLDIVRYEFLPCAVLLECLLDDFEIVRVFGRLEVLKAELRFENVHATTQFELLRLLFKVCEVVSEGVLN